MRCVRRMTSNSLRDRIRNEDLRKRLGREADIDYMKRQQIKWFGHYKTKRNKYNTKSHQYEIWKYKTNRDTKKMVDLVKYLRLWETSQLKRPTEELKTSICLSPQR
jgi:hypothetical protein